MITNFILKLVLAPVIVILCDLLSPYQINYASVYEAILIGLAIAIVGFAVEWLMLRRGTLWITTISDFVFTLCIVFFGSMVFNDARVSTAGALIISLIFGIMEYFIHLWVLRKDFGGRLAAR